MTMNKTPEASKMETILEGKIRIMTVDDHPLVRMALKSLLEKQPDFRLVAEATDGEQAVKLAVQLAPDVILMDITMPRLNGFEATRNIKRTCPNCRVLILTVHDDIEHITGIFEAGANGYLTKGVLGEEVVTAIRSTVAGDSVLSQPVLLQMLKNFVFNVNPTNLVVSEKLSQREIEVLKLLAKGYKNKDIAKTLNLSLPTIKGNSMDIFSKLGASTRTEAVMRALRARIISFSDIE